MNPNTDNTPTPNYQPEQPTTPPQSSFEQPQPVQQPVQPVTPIQPQPPVQPPIQGFQPQAQPSIEPALAAGDPAKQKKLGWILLVPAVIATAIGWYYFGFAILISALIAVYAGRLGLASKSKALAIVAFTYTAIMTVLYILLLLATR